MGSKKTATGKGSDGTRSRKAAESLAMKADKELEILLKRTEAGTITQDQLKHGLVELKRKLGAIDFHIHIALPGPKV